MTIPFRRRTESECFVLVFSLLTRNFPRLLVVSLLFTLPSIIVQTLEPFDPFAWIFFDPTGTSQIPVHGLAGLFFLITLPLLLGSVLVVVERGYTGERVSIARSIAVAVRHYVALTIYGVLLCARILACWFLGTALNALFAATCAWGVLVMMPALFVASLLMSMFYVGMPAIVAEDLGVIQALARSIRLSREHKFDAFRFMLGIVLVSLAIIAGISLPLGIFGPPLWKTLENGNQAQEIVISVITWLMMVTVGLLNTIAPVVIYCQLRAMAPDFDLISVADFVDRIPLDRDTTDSESKEK